MIMSEKLNSELKRLFKTGFFHIFGSSVANKIIGFLSCIVLIRILSKTEYGAFTYAWNIYSIIILFNTMGIEFGVLQLSCEHSGDTEYVNKTHNYGVRFGLRFNILLAVILLGIGLFAPLKIEGSTYLLCALCLLTMVQLLYELTGCYLRSLKRNQEYAKYQVTNSILVLVLSAGCAFLFREMGMVIGHYASCIVAYLIGLFVLNIHLIK